MSLINKERLKTLHDNHLIRVLIKVFFLFLILYIPTYCITYLIYKMSFYDYETLDISTSRYLLILDILVNTPMAIYLLLLIIYIKIKNIEIEFVNNKNETLKKIVISLILIYLVSLILDPFYHNFNMDSIPILKLKSFSLDGFFLDVLLVLIIAPIFEELFFRALLLKPFLKENFLFLGIVTTSILYAVSHFYITNSNYNLDYLSLINYFLIGVVFSILRIRYGLLYAILAHFFYNLLGLSYSKGIVNLYLLDYIKSNYIYWGIYVLMVLTVLCLVYRLLRRIRQ